jgi:hypothetical protein
MKPLTSYSRRNFTLLLAGTHAWVWQQANAQSASPGGGGPPAGAARPADLVGHWRTTSTAFDTVTDTHLVLEANGRASNWTVTPHRRNPPHVGQWWVEGRELKLRLLGRDEWELPYTLHNGDLVFPNIPNRRRFWERVQ